MPQGWGLRGRVGPAQETHLCCLKETVLGFRIKQFSSPSSHYPTWWPTWVCWIFAHIILVWQFDLPRNFNCLKKCIKIFFFSFIISLRPYSPLILFLWNPLSGLRTMFLEPCVFPFSHESGSPRWLRGPPLHPPIPHTTHHIAGTSFPASCGLVLISSN